MVLCEVGDWYNWYRLEHRVDMDGKELVKDKTADVSDNGDLDALFGMLPEGTRIIIDGNRVTFENLTGDMLDVALSLNPDDPDLKERSRSRLGGQDSGDSGCRGALKDCGFRESKQQ